MLRITSNHPNRNKPCASDTKIRQRALRAGRCSYRKRAELENDTLLFNGFRRLTSNTATRNALEQCVYTDNTSTQLQYSGIYADNNKLGGFLNQKFTGRISRRWVSPCCAGDGEMKDRQARSTQPGLRTREGQDKVRNRARANTNYEST